MATQEQWARAGAGNVRVLFARIGWMKFYNGPHPGDEGPVGGGAYNETSLGHEAYNFCPAGGWCHGYVRAPGKPEAISIRRVTGEAGSKAEDVVVALVAKRPSGGQVLVGWYRGATVFAVPRPMRRPGLNEYRYHFKTPAPQAVLLPTASRSVEVPRGKGTIGRAQVAYARTEDGTWSPRAWMREMYDFIVTYDGPNLVANPEEEVAKGVGQQLDDLRAAQAGQGFVLSTVERKRLEDHAMESALRHFRGDYDVEDTHKRKPYDLVARKPGVELFIEVKGTQGSPAAVFLTHGEVAHARGHAEASVLYVLHSIEMRGQRGSRHARGGERLVVSPWKVDAMRLTPISYRCETGL